MMSRCYLQYYINTNTGKIPKMSSLYYFSFFFFNDTATTEIYTLSLHDALPICRNRVRVSYQAFPPPHTRQSGRGDRKSTRLNSSHRCISYAVFCLKKKKYHQNPGPTTITGAPSAPAEAALRQASTPDPVIPGNPVCSLWSSMQALFFFKR